MTESTLIIEHSAPAPAGVAGSTHNLSLYILLSRCLSENRCPAIIAQVLISEDQYYPNRSFYIFQGKSTKILKFSLKIHWNYLFPAIKENTQRNKLPMILYMKIK